MSITNIGLCIIPSFLLLQVPDLINDGWTKIMRNLQQKFMDTRKKAMRAERAERTERAERAEKAEREGTGDTGGVDTVDTVDMVDTVKGINALMEIADHEQVLVQCLHCVYSSCVYSVHCLYSSNHYDGGFVCVGMCVCAREFSKSFLRVVLICNYGYHG